MTSLVEKSMQDTTLETILPTVKQDTNFSTKLDVLWHGLVGD